MQKVLKKICLEQFRTRYPVIFPSVIDGEISYVSHETMELHRNANYYGTPLNLNSNITGYYSNFTKEMELYYSGESLSYLTVIDWYEDFKEYYNILYNSSENMVYSSLTHYYNVVMGDSINYSEYEEKDELFKRHGGSKFYQWLLDNYFGEIIFRDEYDRAEEDGVTLYLTKSQWLNVISNSHLSTMFYADAYDFFEQMSRWHDLYKDTENCYSAMSCCNCSEYLTNGGNTMYNILDNWIKRIEKKLAVTNKVAEVKKNNLMPNITLNVNINRKVEDFGNFNIFCKEFIAGYDYHIGNVCIYEDEVYQLISTPSYKTDSDTGVKVFNPDAWAKYIITYRNTHYNEFVVYDEDYLLSGRTSSMLEDFEDYTFDTMGNALPGKYVPDEESTSIQPSEGSIIDLPFTIGKAINIKLVTNDEKNASNSIKQYFGDVLTSIYLYGYDEYDGVIDGANITCNQGENIIDGINEVLLKCNNLGYTSPTLKIDFIYYKNASFHYSNQKIVLEYKSGDKGNYIYGIKCIDHCTLEKTAVMYYMSEGDCYPIYYYKIIYDTEEITSDTYGKTNNVNMCDFFVYPTCYDTNNSKVTACPIFRKEYILGYSGPESIKDNIYIDRGYATVMDRHLKLSEVTNMNALLRYGNHSFDIINLEEENSNG